MHYFTNLKYFYLIIEYIFCMYSVSYCRTATIFSTLTVSWHLVLLHRSKITEHWSIMYVFGRFVKGFHYYHHLVIKVFHSLLMIFQQISLHLIAKTSSIIDLYLIYIAILAYFAIYLFIVTCNSCSRFLLDFSICSQFSHIYSVLLDTIFQ